MKIINFGQYNCEGTDTCISSFLLSLLGLVGVDVKALGIPTEEEFVSLYSEMTGTADLTHKWNFYMAFTFFRVAAILQGVYKRSLQSERRGREGERERETEWLLSNLCFFP